MPAALAIPLIVGAIGAGTSIYGAVSGSSGSSAADIQQTQEQQAAADAAKQSKADSAQRQQLLAKQVGNAQEQTGGYLSDSGFNEFVATLAGLPGYSNQASSVTGVPNTGAGGNVQSAIASLADNPASGPSENTGFSTGGSAPSSKDSFSLSNLQEMIQKLLGQGALSPA